MIESKSKQQGLAERQRHYVRVRRKREL